MPRDGSGVYSLPAGNPVVTNTVIASAWANTTMSDIAAQLNNVLTRDGLLGPTGPFKIVDGTVNAPGLAFNSEPGLGWWRYGAGQIGLAAQGKTIADFSRNSATLTTLFLSPSAAGVAQHVLRNQALESANFNQLLLAQLADGSATLATGAGGSATRGNLTIDAPSVIATGTVNVTSGTLGLYSTGTYASLIFQAASGAGKQVRLGSSNNMEYVNAANSAVITYMSDAGVWTASGSFNPSSDERIKHDIVPIQLDTEAFMRIAPISFKRNLDPESGDHWGFSAQNLHGTFPLAVVGDVTATKEDGSPEPAALDITAILAQTVLATQNLMATIKTLNQRLAQLENA